VRPGEPIVLPQEFADYLDWTLRIAPELTFVFWFEERIDGVDGPRLGRRTPARRQVLVAPARRE
jgi:hypothetical protein